MFLSICAGKSGCRRISYPEVISGFRSAHAERGREVKNKGEGASQSLGGKSRPCGGGVEIGAYEFCRPAEPLFRRGDTNADGDRNLSDALVILSYLFNGGGDPPCLDAADSDDTGDVNLADSIYLLSYLFSAGEPPVRPFGACGVDSTKDGLTCENFAACP